MIIRTSPVMDSSGGPFRLMRLAWSCGFGATIGDGSQRMPMISLRDYLAVVRWAATSEHAAGPYNLTLPQPTTNAEFTDALAAALHRPRFLRVPTVAIRAALGELAEQITEDMCVVPKRPTSDGFAFTDPTVEYTIRLRAAGLIALAVMNVFFTPRKQRPQLRRATPVDGSGVVPGHPVCRKGARARPIAPGRQIAALRT